MKNIKFTLIELLLVIAVVAVLLSMLLPAISSSRKNALSASCKNNLRQVGIAVEGYSSDNNGMVRAGYPTDWAPHMNWNQLFYILEQGGYIKIGKSTSCSEAPPATWSVDCYGARYYYGKKSELASYWFVGCSYRDSGYYPKMRPNNTGYAEPYLVHLGKSNMGFNDGHVSSSGPVDLKSMADSEFGGSPSGFNYGWFGSTPERLGF